ncbi:MULTISPECIES: extracellular solute-binding protein [unclassified Oceanispirochaeta]|uniref:extracellular solute-binding protein n=1 Tax=unclassified Oceanispirochaeta TaxID=2635722 RepID=UPI000E0977DD|nr:MULTISPECIES: extracellular solute-binding protein [unclassified Oceanispirochaeta]MBF9017614.1 extracellular solute-binding protein [Oceanispirochaeta sp. M2]NPD74186.1 extracellular solute-binding protein [Oceanispirochaeta sp. M1]RDG29999.1 extracellular solute-binding protein [Oceanispirochaeta sp. M1]
MKSKRFSITSLILGALMAVSMVPGLFATGQQDAGETKEVMVNPAGQFPIVDEKITLSAFIEQRALVEDLNTNDTTVFMEDKTNIHLDMLIVPTEAIAEKKQLLLASGQYPDIFLSGYFTNEDIMRYGPSEQVFVPLTDLIDKYAPNIKKAGEDIPGFLESLTAPDGEIYGLPTINECYHCSYNPKYWVYKPWLDALGMKIPETTEDFYQMLKAFKTQDPNGNGIQDEIPLSGSPNGWYSKTEHFIMNAFVFDDGGSVDQEYFFQVNNGNLDFVADTEGWRDGLRFMNRLYNEGLYDPASFTQDYTQLREMGNNSDAVILGSSAAGHPGVFVTISEEIPRHKDYVSIRPLTGPSGVQYSVPTPFKAVKGAMFTITDKCKNPKAAIRLADYMYSFEGSMLLDVGIEGKTWKAADIGKKDFSGNQAVWEQLSDYMEIDNTSWKEVGPSFRSFASVRGTKAQPQDPMAADGFETRLFQETNNNYEPYAPKEVFLGDTFLGLEEIEEAAQLRLHIVDYVKQSMIRFIIGDLDIEKDWDNYVQSLKDINVDEYVSVYRNAYSN